MESFKCYNFLNIFCRTTKKRADPKPLEAPRPRNGNYFFQGSMPKISR